ncbi:HlyD family efflux transporter periplasmic adaptor subunit [Eubacteriaceae bacterium ES3]|nr:HlyD family efflux transporter periplasmic adaptor subunit [Eubacteriaceae bacterium ES3]
MEKKSIFKEQKPLKKEHVALITVIGPKNLLVLLGVLIFLAAVIIFSVTVPINITVSLDGTVAYGEGSINVSSDLNGTVTQIAVSKGDYVNKGDLLGVITSQTLESSYTSGLSDEQVSEVKRQTMIVAPDSGVVNEMLFQEGEMIEKNEVVFTISKADQDSQMGVVVIQSDYGNIQNVTQGDEVFIELSTLPSSEYGYLQGIVRTIEKQDGQANDLATIIIDPKVDAEGNYIWTKANEGAEQKMLVGISAAATIFTDKLYLWNLVIS